MNRCVRWLGIILSFGPAGTCVGWHLCFHRHMLWRAVASRVTARLPAGACSRCAAYVLSAALCLQRVCTRQAVLLGRVPIDGGQLTRGVPCS